MTTMYMINWNVVAPCPKLNTIPIIYDLVVYLLLHDDYMINLHVVAPCPKLNTIPIKYDLVVYRLLHYDYNVYD